MKKFYYLFIIVLSLLLSSFKGYAQFFSDTIINQTPIQEVRKGSTAQYSVSAGHVDGEQYTWGIVGGTPTPAPNSGSGTQADPYIINFTPNLHTITVNWSTDNQKITSQVGQVRVQKRTNAGCISVIQSLDIACWSAPTISIIDADDTICSGDPTTRFITVQFTGAPNFDFRYTLKDLDGTTSAEQIVTGITGASTTIPLPSNLVNTSTTTNQTYVVTITQMNDSFTGDGNVVDGTFTITVHPSISTGTIQASPALQRR
jgi:hypothetical protein